MSNCPGVREDDTVRPLAMCQSCAHWRSTTGERVTPWIQIRHDGAQPILLCGRRQAVKGWTMRAMTLYHATTPKKAALYRATGRIIKPVRGFTTLQGAMAWACKTGRSVVLEIAGADCHKLPDHHNEWGEAWWVDHDVSDWRCVMSPGRA